LSQMRFYDEHCAGHEGERMTPAIFSEDRVYRYTLSRTWFDFQGVEVAADVPRYVNFICLNPSTADETKDDPTVRRCVGYAKAWRFDGLVVTNIFAFRSTVPAALYRPSNNPTGPRNDYYIRQVASMAALVVCAWGEHAKLNGRGDAVRKLIRDVCDPHYLRLNASGRPAHPLYLPASLEPIQWQK
jgi:hypothetical protein